jgi:hypothetical protein
MNDARSKVRRYIAQGREGSRPVLSKKAKKEIATRRRIGDAKLAALLEHSAQQAARGGEAGQPSTTTYDGRARER